MIGSAMIFLLFFGLFMFACKQIGLKEAVLTYLLTFALFAWVWTAVYLIGVGV